MDIKQIIHHFEGESPDIIELIIAARSLILEIVPNATESVVWNVLSYHDSTIGGRVKGAICQIDAREGNVNLGFIHGGCLPDPEFLLQGDQKSKRFLPIKSKIDLKRPALIRLIEAAAEFPKILTSKTNEL